MKKATTGGTSAAGAEEPLTAASFTAPTKFKDLEETVLTPAGWRRYHEVVLSTFEDRVGAVWRVMRLYTHADRQKGGLIAIKSQVTRDSTPFITLYRETEAVP